MRQSPFIVDPRNLFSQHLALAVESPMEEIAAMHIRQAEHQAETAKASGLQVDVLKP